MAVASVSHEPWACAALHSGPGSVTPFPIECLLAKSLLNIFENQLHLSLRKREAKKLSDSSKSQWASGRIKNLVQAFF